MEERGRDRPMLAGVIILALWAGPMTVSAQSNSTAPASSGGSVGAPQAQPARPGNRSSQEASQNLEQTGVTVEWDARLFTVIAALNVAGYDYETGSAGVSPLRQAVRQDLAGLDRELRDRMRAYFRSHRLVGVDESGQVARYVALSFLVSPPPQFAVPVEQQHLPADVVPLLDFVPLLREFYERGALARLIPRYMQQEQAKLREYQEETARVVLDTINYLHTRPVLSLALRYAGGGARQGSKPPKGQRKGEESDSRGTARLPKSRERRLYVLPNLFDARESAYVRNDIPNGSRERTANDIGDDYLVAVGPSSESLVSAVRVGFLRFALEPLGELNAREIRSRTEAVRLLFRKVTNREPDLSETAFFLVTQSLSAAAEARLKVLSVPAASPEMLAEREEDALYGLSSQYQRGAVLAFHFYEKLIPWERVGTDLAGYYEELITSISFGREFDRPAEIQALRMRAEKRRADRATRIVREPPAERLAAADALIQKRQYAEARTMLEEILKADPEQARALYGLAQSLSGLASQIDPQKATDPNLAQDQVTENLLEAVRLFRRAAERARPPSELWIASQARVAAGKILDFFGERAAAMAEYRIAIEIGPVAGGAYDQARSGLERPLSR